jgi:large subunit ribosomal protein L19
VNVIEKIEAEQATGQPVDFRAGDTLRVHAKIIEGEKERIQVFEGVCIRRTRRASRATFTVRKTSYGVGVERTFPLHSPRIDRIEVKSRGIVRRSRLYYLRKLTGKAARIRARR